VVFGGAAFYNLLWPSLDSFFFFKKSWGKKRKKTVISLLEEKLKGFDAINVRYPRSLGKTLSGEKKKKGGAEECMQGRKGKGSRPRNVKETDRRREEKNQQCEGGEKRKKSACDRWGGSCSFSQRRKPNGRIKDKRRKGGEETAFLRKLHSRGRTVS